MHIEGLHALNLMIAKTGVARLVPSNAIMIDYNILAEYVPGRIEGRV